VLREGMQLEEEGCLSVPGFNATVVRPEKAIVKGLDRTGAEHQREGTGLLARAFQHEMDHLDGTLFVDRLRGIKRDLIVRRIKKLTRAGKW
jgi:peptide deformylase